MAGERAAELTAHGQPLTHVAALKHRVHSRQQWRRIDDGWSFFELDWRPKKWSEKRRLICIRRRRAGRRAGPLQLDLFEPVDPEFDFKVIVTNKTTCPCQRSAGSRFPGVIPSFNVTATRSSTVPATPRRGA